MKRQFESQQFPEPQTKNSAAVTSHSSSSPLPSSPLPMTTPNLTRWIFRGIALGLTTLTSAVVGATIALMLPLPEAIAPSGDHPSTSINDLWSRGLGYQITRPVNILVMGMDLPLDLPDNVPSNDVFAGRSDTMLLVHVDPMASSVSVLSIPRDTQVEIPFEGVEKINYANVLGGPELSAQVVSQNLQGVTIDRYVRVSTGAFRELVDLLGGVRVFVPERMQYEDQTQKLTIDLQPGWQVLNGEQAEQFARFRNDANGDIGRVQRQQQLIQALREKLTNPSMLPHIPQAIQLFQKYIDTNLSLEEMVSLAHLGLGLERDNFRMVLLPGRFSTPEEFEASYWLMDANGVAQVMEEHFDISSVATITHDYRAVTELSIAVQNASSYPELGSEVAAYLQEQGFDNVYVVEDWPDHQGQTQIIAQGGDLRSASMLESTLGVGDVIPTSTGDLQSDLTIRIGDDWMEERSNLRGIGNDEEI